MFSILNSRILLPLLQEQTGTPSRRSEIISRGILKAYTWILEDGRLDLVLGVGSEDQLIVEQNEVKIHSHYLLHHFVRGGTWLRNSYTCLLYKFPLSSSKCLHPKLVQWFHMKAFKVLFKTRCPKFHHRLTESESPGERSGESLFLKPFFPEDSPEFQTASLTQIFRLASENHHSKILPKWAQSKSCTDHQQSWVDMT